MDTAEILYDAFKESFIQARRVYRVTITAAILTLLIILLVVRDGVILNTAEPKMMQYSSAIGLLDKQLENESAGTFRAPKAYTKAQSEWQRAKKAVDSWAKNFPARKKMQEKYLALLQEYSSQHDKVMGRLKIDGEPGLELYQQLRALMEEAEQAKLRLDKAEAQRLALKKQYTQAQSSERYRLNEEKRRLEREMVQMRADVERIQHDQTRLPWLGLSVNPRDLLTLMPLLLLALFHVLFDAFDELLSIMRRPELKPHTEALRAYPVPAFLQRRTVFSWLTVALLYGLIPLIQIVAVIMVYHYQIGLLGFSPDSWMMAVSIGAVATALTIAHPVIMLSKHYAVLNGSSRVG